MKALLTQKGAGNYTVTMFNEEAWEQIGSFETTDMQLVDDINTVQENQGTDDEIEMFDTIDEMYEYCVSKID